MQLIDSEGKLFLEKLSTFMYTCMYELISKSRVTLNYLRRSKGLIHHYLSKLLKHRYMQSKTNASIANLFHLPVQDHLYTSLGYKQTHKTRHLWKRSRGFSRPIYKFKVILHIYTARQISIYLFYCLSRMVEGVRFVWLLNFISITLFLKRTLWKLTCVCAGKNT